MNANYAIIDRTNTVVNIVVWDGETDWAPPEGCQAIAFTGVVAIGYTWDGNKFNPP